MVLFVLAAIAAFAQDTSAPPAAVKKRRRITTSAVGVSLFATLLSTIFYLAVPSEMINKGPAILYGTLGLPIAFVLVGYWLIPALMR